MIFSSLSDCLFYLNVGSMPLPLLLRVIMGDRFSLLVIKKFLVTVQFLRLNTLY